MMGAVHCQFETPVGSLRVVATEEGLVALLWPDDEGRVRLPPSQQGSNPIIEQTRRQVGEYFAGTRRTFDLPVTPLGTEFQKQVWATLESIPYGTTTTYGTLAGRLGRPTAARAVGAANGRNPISIIVPCHRVIGKNGSLTGFGGGLATKRFLLDLESGTKTLPV